MFTKADKVIIEKALVSLIMAKSRKGTGDESLAEIDDSAAFFWNCTFLIRRAKEIMKKVEDA